MEGNVPPYIYQCTRNLVKLALENHDVSESDSDDSYGESYVAVLPPHEEESDFCESNSEDDKKLLNEDLSNIPPKLSEVLE